MSSFPPAKQAEIIRSNQKDGYYIAYIKGALADITQSWLGPRRWIHWRRELDLLADVGYFLLTTVSGYQTLGEEYVNILQVDSSHRAIPSRLRRGAMVLLQVVTPYALHRLLDWLEKEMRHNMSLNISEQGRSSALELIKIARHIITILHRCHLAIFYMSGVFYHIAKRFTGINYLLVRPDMPSASRPNYKILGWLSLIQLAFTFLQQGYKMLQRSRLKKTSPSGTQTDGSASKVSGPEITVEPQRKCALCLEMRQHSTATPCGHLFCWDCIVEWCSSKPQCPLCREPSELNRLVCLKNFDPS